jgi:hypothetical protein
MSLNKIAPKPVGIGDKKILEITNPIKLFNNNIESGDKWILNVFDNISNKLELNLNK